MTVALGLVLIGVLLVYGGVTGKSIKHLLLGDNSVSRTPPTPTSNVPSIAGGTSAGGMSTSTGGTYKGYIHELFFDPLNIAFDEGNWIGNIGNHSDHVHVGFADPEAALEIIAYAQALGLRTSENPYVGGVAKGVHTDSSWHYKTFPGSYNGKTLGMGLDVSGPYERMAQFANWVKLTYTNKKIPDRK